jgi:hypothetical protein
VALVLVAVHLCGAACRRQPPRADIVIESSFSPAPPSLGPATLRLRLTDRSGHPVGGARLRVEAQMSHPGMAPVTATAVERGPGEYAAALDFPMRGDWILLVSGSLADGRTVSHRIDVRSVR